MPTGEFVKLLIFQERSTNRIAVFTYLLLRIDAGKAANITSWKQRQKHTFHAALLLDALVQNQMNLIFKFLITFPEKKMIGTIRNQMQLIKWRHCNEAFLHPVFFPSSRSSSAPEKAVGPSPGIETQDHDSCLGGIRWANLQDDD